MDLIRNFTLPGYSLYLAGAASRSRVLEQSMDGVGSDFPAGVNLARKCLANVKALVLSSYSSEGSMLFKRSQCECLVYKLQEAVEKTEGLWALVKILRSPSSDDSKRESFGWTTKEVERFREVLNKVSINYYSSANLLGRIAKEVESFIDGHYLKSWIEAAMVMANVSERVSQLIMDLESCILSLPNINSQASIIHLDSLTQEERVSKDQSFLLTKLEDVVHSRKSNDQERQLAKCLASRLSQHLSRKVCLSDWEVDRSGLERKARRSLLGAGSSGRVHKARWLGIDVAEKEFYGSDYPVFIEEVEILAGLSHPNITPLFGYAADQNSCYIIMERMDGDLGNLKQDRLRQKDSLFEAADFMLQTAEGMRYLHDKKVVHRDLKPQNILVKATKNTSGNASYFIKVADFGLSRTRESSVTYSDQCTNVGTTRWMAPEVMWPKDDSSMPSHPLKTDVYSFGLVCYEIVTGQEPFQGKSNPVVRAEVLNGGRPEIPDGCPETLQALICSCWDAEPGARPSFVVICEELRRLEILTQAVGRIQHWST